VYLRVEVEFAHTDHTTGTLFADIWLDSIRLIPANGGWAAQAFGPGVNNATNFGSTTNLATVSAGLGGAVGQWVVVPAPMVFNQYSIWNTDTSLQRDAEVRLYRDVADANALAEVPGARATYSFIPGAASARLAAINHPGTALLLEPGQYLAVLRNTSTARTFGLGFLGSGSQVIMNNAVSRTNAAALGTTLDINNGWPVTGAVFALGLRGRVQGGILAW
jgi:hypothetical protein